MARRMHFEIEEWYHCFNRGVDKRDVFENENDANRFLMLLYLANSNMSVDFFNIKRPRLGDIIQEERGNPIVAIGAYCLMPNHYHLLLKEIVEGGITSFMRKIGTAYTMYFNARNDRVGHLFTGPFRSRHVTGALYFQKMIQYIHCNPAELYEPTWKSGVVRNILQLEKKLIKYPYSSLESFARHETKNSIISPDVFSVADRRSVGRMLTDAREYYADLAKDSFER